MGKRPLLDIMTSHGLVTIPGSVDVAGSEIGLLLTNASGRIFSVVLPPGTLISSRTGTSFKYFKVDAKIHGGPYKILIAVRGMTYRCTVQAFGDLSAATDPLISLQFYIGSQPTPAFLTETWTHKKYGWVFVEPWVRR